MVQMLRSRGHTNLTREEEELRSRLETLMRQFQQPEFHSRFDEVTSHVRSLKASQDLVQSETTRRSISFEVTDEQTLNDIFRVLNDMQNGLQQLTHVVQNDLKTTGTMAKGYAQVSIKSNRTMEEPGAFALKP
jgi:hypothetical protein